MSDVLTKPPDFYLSAEEPEGGALLSIIIAPGLLKDYSVQVSMKQRVITKAKRINKHVTVIFFLPKGT